MKISYNWIQEYIEDKLPSVETVVEALTMHSFEIEGVENHGEDKILDVKILPNRAHDCLSHFGVASEVASVLNLKRKDLLPQVTLPTTDKLSVNINTKSCSRQMFVLVTGVKVTESPAWLKEKLATQGSRSINAIVDMTNYLTFAFTRTRRQLSRPNETHLGSGGRCIFFSNHGRRVPYCSKRSLWL